MAHPIFFRRSSACGWAVAWFLDDGGRHDHEPVAAERNRPDFHPHAVCDGRRWLSARGSYRQASALRHALDCDHRLGGDLRWTRDAFADATHYDLQLAAGCDHGTDCAGSVAN